MFGNPRHHGVPSPCGSATSERRMTIAPAPSRHAPAVPTRRVPRACSGYSICARSAPCVTSVPR